MPGTWGLYRPESRHFLPLNPGEYGAGVHRRLRLPALKLPDKFIHALDMCTYPAAFAAVEVVQKPAMPTQRVHFGACVFLRLSETMDGTKAPRLLQSSRQWRRITSAYYLGYYNYHNKSEITAIDLVFTRRAPDGTTHSPYNASHSQADVVDWVGDAARRARV